MSKKPFQLRLDTDQLDRLARVAATMQMSKTEIVEAGINMRLDLLEGYSAMDKGPPKKPKGRAVTIVAGEVVSSKPLSALKPKAKGAKTVKLTGGAIARKPIGWDAAGDPIYRGK